jgi:hypothetical protein
VVSDALTVVNKCSPIFVALKEVAPFAAGTTVLKLVADAVIPPVDATRLNGFAAILTRARNESNELFESN